MADGPFKLSYHCATALLVLMGSFLCVFSAAALAVETPTWRELYDLSRSELKATDHQHKFARYWLMRARTELNQSMSAAELALQRALESEGADGPDERLMISAVRCAIQLHTNRAEAETVCQELERLLPSATNPLPAAIAHLDWGIYLAETGRYDEELATNRHAEQLAKRAGATRLLSLIIINRGVTYSIRGLPRLALTQFQRAREMQGQSNDSGHLEFLSLNIAVSQIDEGNFQEGLDILTRVMQSPDYRPDSPYALLDFTWLARAHLGLGRPEQAKAVLEPKLNGVDDQIDSGTLGTALVALARIQVAMGELGAGQATFQRAMTMGQQVGEPLMLHRWQVRFATSLRQQNQLTLAEAALKNVIEEYQSISPSMALVHALRQLALVETQKGRTAEAAELQRRAQALSKNIYGNHFELELSMLQSQVEAHNGEHQLALAKRDAVTNQLRAQRSLLLRNFTIVCAILLALIIYLFLSRRFTKRLALVQQESNEQLESQVNERSQALEREMAERLHAEQQQHNLEQNLAESEKLRAIGQLTSGVAHDFNNLMTVVTLSAELIKTDERIQGTNVAAHAEEILNAAETGSNITTGLLAFARKQPLQATVTNLQTYMTEALPILKRTLGEGIELDTHLESCWVKVDRTKLTTSIINLLVNAKEAMGGRGKVQIIVEPQPADESQAESVAYASIRIIDTGPGMSDQAVARSIEPFYTTKNAGHGSGLGLSMVYGFAKQSGGDLLIESTMTVGTRVSLLIPQCDDADQNTEEPIADRPATKLIPGTVLVVEDQPQVRAVLCQLLEQLGMQPIGADSGDEGLKILQQNAQAATPPDLLISDVMMPGATSAQQMVDYARTTFPSLPVLMMSGYTDAVEQDVHFLHKPFSLQELRDKVILAMENRDRTH